MGCFSLMWLEQLCVWLIIAFAIIAIIRLVLPALASLIPFPVVGQIIQIALWVVVAIFAVYAIFALLGCLLGAGAGLHFPRA